MICQNFGISRCKPVRQSSVSFDFFHFFEFWKHQQRWPPNAKPAPSTSGDVLSFQDQHLQWSFFILSVFRFREHLQRQRKPILRRKSPLRMFHTEKLKSVKNRIFRSIFEKPNSSSESASKSALDKHIKWNTIFLAQTTGNTLRAGSLIKPAQPCWPARRSLVASIF